MAIDSGKTSIFSVPIEILREIATALITSGDKAAFSRTARLFNVITIPVLFRDVYLNSMERTLGCLEILGRNAKRQDCVRTLRIQIAPSGGRSPDYVPTDIIFPLEAVLRNLPNLSHLSLRIPDFDDRYLVIFATLSLPSLRSFSTLHPGSYAPLFSAFLTRHTDLTHLDFIRPWCEGDGDGAPPRVPPLHLPRLRSYRGCSVYACALVTTDVEALFAALGDASVPATPFELTFLWDGEASALFEPLAASIPHIHALTVGPFIASNSALTPAIVQKIAEPLEALVGLASLDLDSFTDDTEKHAMSADLAALTTWSAHCPSLVTSRLHCRNWARGREVGSG
ncbi:hypothetical protein DFH09DRAFT_1367223 [Mycena vulgaris]|nr:hypothetical protein DFH09DRAFT_1367223 [Mycena vulgaris]